jgi:hypothetical protein
MSQRATTEFCNQKILFLIFLKMLLFWFYGLKFLFWLRTAGGNIENLDESPKYFQINIHKKWQKGSNWFNCSDECVQTLWTMIAKISLNSSIWWFSQHEAYLNCTSDTLVVVSSVLNNAVLAVWVLVFAFAWLSKAYHWGEYWPMCRYLIHFSFLKS